MIMEIEAIPLTPNKKIDWKALPTPDKINALNNMRAVLPELKLNLVKGLLLETSFCIQHFVIWLIS